MCKKKKQDFANEQIKLSAFWVKDVFVKPGFTHVDTDFFSLPPLASLDNLMSQLDKNPDVLALDNQIRLRAAELRQAKSERETNVSWNAGIRRLQTSDDSAFVVGLSVPLSSSNRATGAIITASANQAVAELERNTTLTRLQIHLTNLHSTYGQAVAEINNLNKGVLPLLTQAMRATSNGFNQGRYSYLELNLAQRELLDMRMELIDATQRAHLLVTEIERITGAALSTQSLSIQNSAENAGE